MNLLGHRNQSFLNDEKNDLPDDGKKDFEDDIHHAKVKRENDVVEKYLIFSLNVFTEFPEFSDTKIFVFTVKWFKPAISCVRELDTTTVPATHM